MMHGRSLRGLVELPDSDGGRGVVLARGTSTSLKPAAHRRMRVTSSLCFSCEAALELLWAALGSQLQSRVSSQLPLLAGGSSFGVAASVAHEFTTVSTLLWGRSFSRAAAPSGSQLQSREAPLGSQLQSRMSSQAAHLGSQLQSRMSSRPPLRAVEAPPLIASKLSIPRSFPPRIRRLVCDPR